MLSIISKSTYVFINNLLGDIYNPLTDVVSISVNDSTSVDPVKAILSMSMWEAMAAPAVLPNPGKMFTAPGGNPAWGKKMGWSKLS